MIAIQKKRGNEYIKEEIKKYQYYLKNKEQIDDYKREYFKKKEQEEEENNEEKNKLWGKLLFELFL
ncbi:MAG: hypothetical protein LBU14_05720 [Candidatus Peribacteria bacterium]|nr:hypothetical protein [Candidatus Peribacteria bacterium]